MRPAARMLMALLVVGCDASRYKDGFLIEHSASRIRPQLGG